MIPCLPKKAQGVNKTPCGPLSSHHDSPVIVRPSQLGGTLVRLFGVGGQQLHSRPVAGHPLQDHHEHRPLESRHGHVGAELHLNVRGSLVAEHSAHSCRTLAKPPLASMKDGG